jgi:hypothetical protein
VAGRIGRGAGGRSIPFVKTQAKARHGRAAQRRRVDEWGVLLSGDDDGSEGFGMPDGMRLQAEYVEQSTPASRREIEKVSSKEVMR